MTLATTIRVANVMARATRGIFCPGCNWMDGWRGVYFMGESDGWVGGGMRQGQALRGNNGGAAMTWKLKERFGNRPYVLLTTGLERHSRSLFS